ncbi:MAG: ABC transporter substrate-binding protein [Actinobacteria bacterium]|nr:ABC transporter substrate-binding protein [Actinomycetota bacterium]
MSATLSRSRRLTRRLVAGLTAAVVVGALAACSSPAQDAGSTGAAGAGTGTLSLGLVGSVNDTLFPYAAQSTAGEGAIWRNTFDTLTQLDNKGVLQMGLAESFTPNADNTVWTVKLRPDVKLHSGATFGADDVLFSIKKMFELKDSFGAITQISSFVSPDKVKKIDDLTVEFTLSTPYGIFPSAWAYEQLAMIGKTSTDKDVDGTGPFTVGSFEPNRQASLTRFDDYWGEKPGFDKLEVYFFADQQAIVNALQGGQIDLTSAVPLSNVDALKASGIEFLESDSATHLTLDMRTDMAPFDDPRVRQALQLIVDRDAVVKTAYNGYAKVGNDVDLASGCPAPDLPQRKQDLQKAKQLLAEAGKSDLNVDLVTDGAFQGMSEVAQLINQDAAQIGVTVNVKTMDTGSLLDKWLQWPFVVNLVGSSYLTSMPGHLLPDGQDNASHWNNADFANLATELFNTTDTTKQCAVIEKLQAVQYADSPSIIPALPKDLTPHSARVKGLRTDPYGHTSESFAGVTVTD